MKTRTPEFRAYNMATTSKVKQEAYKEAKELGLTHTEDINQHIILMLSCRLADEINARNAPFLTDCISEDE